MSARVPQFVVVDTGILAYLTKSSELSEPYDALIGSRRIAVSFQTEAELLSSDYAARRQARLDHALALTLRLPHSDETNVWYANIARARKLLKASRSAGGDVGDADVWIIAGAAEYGLALISHDRQMVHLGRSIGHRVYTVLPSLRSDNPP